MTKKLALRLAFTILTAFLMFICYSAISIWTFGSKNQLVQTDAAVVLGAAVWDDAPSPVFRERINHAIWLYENEYVHKLIFTGGKSEGNAFAEAEVARAYAIENKVDAADILIETKSTTTEENLKYAHKVTKENDLNTFTIVSDPLHMKRAILLAIDNGMKAYSSPTQSSAYETLKSKVPFFFRELFFYIGYIFSYPFR